MEVGTAPSDVVLTTTAPVEPLTLWTGAPAAAMKAAPLVSWDVLVGIVGWPDRSE